MRIVVGAGIAGHAAARRLETVLAEAEVLLLEIPTGSAGSIHSGEQAAEQVARSLDRVLR